MRQILHGHFWTLAPQLAHSLAPRSAPRDAPWQTALFDPQRGEIALTGWLHVEPRRDLVVLVHGLGGCHRSRYMLEAARACREAGWSYLRFNMRGADRSGEDIYHAGSTADLRAMLRSPELARFEHIYLVGFSLGGHIVLRWATEPDRDPRVRAVATVCAPLDLSYGAHAIQRPLGRPYQWHVLSGLKQMYLACLRRGRVAVPQDVRAIRTILEWDDRVVVPRFGFSSRAEYYKSQSAGPRLRAADLPTLFVAAKADPVVTAEQLRPWLQVASSSVQIEWTPGGHIGFPELRLRGAQSGSVHQQVLRWLQQF